MNNFNYWAPTKVIFGKDAELEVGKEIASRGGHKVLVHYGDTFLQENGILDKVHKSLTDAGLEYVDLDGVVPNPRLSLVRKGIELCKKENIDFLLPIGGGSATDSAKCIAYGIANDDFDVKALILQKIPSDKVKIAPLGCITTIAATGSEMSNAMVITIDDDDNNHLKRTYNNDIGRPLFAILDPVITFTLPKYQIACGAADIMMHTMERYFHNVEGTDLVDHIAEGLLVSVKEAGLVAIKEPTNYDARATLMWAGSLSHNGLTGCGRRADWGAHKLQAEIGGMFERTTHGAGLCAVWGSWARYVYKTNPARFAKFAVRVFGVSEDFADIEGTAIKGIEAWEEWCHKIGMPTSLSELGIRPTPEQIDEMAQKCVDSNGNGYVANFKRLYKDDVKKIYEMAL